MSDENPYEVPHIDEKNWFAGGHLGSQIQKANWQIVNCTTPVNYFHVLRRQVRALVPARMARALLRAPSRGTSEASAFRRWAHAVTPPRPLQIHRSFRKPLVIFTPKNLLRHPKAKSQLLEFDDKADDPNIVGVRFKRLIMDTSETDRSPTPEPRHDVKRLILCAGKVYYELEAAREEAGLQDTIAICRVEQLAPFPFDLVMRELRRYPNAQVRVSGGCTPDHRAPRRQSFASPAGILAVSLPAAV